MASKLPYEILQCIAGYVNNEPDKPNTRDLKAFQLVCKSWSKPAQEALYQHVKLSEHALSFATTITTAAPHVGSFVTKIDFLDEFDKSKKRDAILQAIVQYCVNVKHICSCYLHQTSNIMAFILVDPLNYEKVALKYKTTMKHLYVTHEYLDQETREFVVYRELESNLHLFPALQQLDIVDYVFKHPEKLDQMIDSCSSSLSELFVENWWSQEDIVMPPDSAIKPNTTITKIRLKSARTTPETMQYFAIKFKALKEWVARFNYTTTTSEEGDARTEAVANWWRHLTSISLGLTKYTYGIQLGHNRDESGVNQLKRCLEIAQKTMPPSSPRHFKLEYQCEACHDSNMNSILMSRTPGAYHLSLDHRWRNDFHLPNVVTLLQQMYLPDSIHLLFESHDSEYDNLNYTGEPDSDDSDFDCDVYGFKELSYDFMPAKVIKQAFRDKDIATLWKVFGSLLTLVNPLKNQDLCVENLVAFKQMCMKDLPASTRASKVTFKNCILEHSVLPELSRHLPEIDCLVFDTTCILMDEPRSLKLHLPSTTIHTLKVVIRPLVEALRYYLGQHDYLACKLENKPLLLAMLSDGNYTLKIETESKTYISKRQDGKIVEDNCDEVSIGTDDKFLIWIKCKELNQYLVTNDRTCEDFELLK
ncbi:hypothetical protein MBANPS3_005856 [Mucor bainieri]